MTAPWAAPDAGAPQPARGEASLPPVGPTAGTTAPADPSRTDVTSEPLPPPPLPLRPMTVPDLLDGAFAIIKLRPRDVLVLAAAFVVPIQLLSSILLRDVLSASGFGGTGIGDPTSSVGVEESGELTGVGSTVVSLLIGISSLALLAGALALLVADWYQGRREPPVRTVVRTLKRAPALVVGVVVVHVLEAVGLIGLGIGAYVMMGLLHVVSPVITAEGVGPFRAIGRSMRLTSARFWRSMGIPALVGMIGALLGIGFQLIPEVATLFVSDDWNWLVRSAGSMLSQLIVAPFTAGVAVLYHLDLRMRTEGYDVALTVAALEEGRR